MSALPFVIGPMFYWYIRSVLYDNSELKITDSVHLLLMALYFVISVPQNLAPLSDKISDAITLLNNTDYIAHYKGTPLSSLFPIEAIFLSRPILILMYIMASIVLFVRFIVKRKKTEVLSKQHFMTKWLAFLMGFLLLLVISQILNISRAFDMEFSEMYFTLNFLRLLSGLGLIGLLLSPFFFPAILYGLPRIPPAANQAKKRNAETEQNRETVSKSKLKLEQDYLHHIHRKAEIFMKENQPYLQPGFNLAQLSVKIEVPAHHLGYCFREIKKQTFNDYRNKWRINHAKKLIKEGKASEMTLEAIGMLSGFSSRNAFITDFKKFEGESPGAYASRFN